jgi:two-component system, OmpR family, sensor histidine kinase KdpD
MSKSDPVTFVRTEDLLDETTPQRLSRSFRLSRRRQLTGLVLAVIMLPLLTLLLKALEDQLSLDGQVLVYLLAVVVIAFVGGIVVAIGSAIAAALLINYFFVEPIHTLTVSEPDQVVALAIFVAVAALVSGAIELAVRRAQIAERARAEAETMSSLAGADLEGEESLRDILQRARETFNMESVTLKARQRGTGEWIDAEHVGWAPEGKEETVRFDVPVGNHLRLVGRGPALFAEDHRVLEAFAAAAGTAYEGRVLSEDAGEARALATVDQQRTSLLAAVGHDLRTPLAGIKAAVTSLRQSDVEWSDDERSELLATIEESTDHLDAVVGNLLDASRLQAGALSVQLDSVSLDEVVSGALLAVPGAGGRVAVDVPEDLPLVRADPGLLQRVLVNVLGNALSHGASDQPVEVHAQAGGQSAKVEIVDHGRGVDDLEARRLFEPFQRLDDHGPEGIGLGLSVARGFIEAMDGAMVADQTPGGGLTMRIRLRVASANGREPDTE